MTCGPTLLVHLATLLAAGVYAADQSWTFNVPGVSFISFSPTLSNAQNQMISLKFRTRNANGLVFCHYLKNLDTRELERLNYKLCGEIQYGLFVLTYRLMQFSEDGLILGKALHNDQWHQLDVFINSTSGELTVSVDEHRRVTTLKAYTRQNITSILDWSSHKSAIYYGGTDPDTLFSDIYPHFHGCMSDLRYMTPDNVVSEVKVAMMSGVEQGCRDWCQDDPCHHGGRCINMYSHAACDCFGTSYEGTFCSDFEPSTVTLRGYEWLTYKLHKDVENILTETLRLSMEFKTNRGSGVLFYAVGGSPYHSHLTASVHNGTLQVSVAFGDEDLEFFVGVGMDNYRWHNLTVVHDAHSVHVYVDGQVTTKRIQGDVWHLGLDPLVFIGGGEEFVVTRGLQVTQNFVGCLKNVYLNEVSVLHQLTTGSPSIQYHGSGSTRPRTLCMEVVNIPISFPTSHSMLMVNSQPDMKYSFEVEFDFKTVREDAIVLYLSLEDTDHSMEYNYGYIEVWIRGGQPHLRFTPAKMYPERTQNLTIPTTVNTNKWRSMHLSFIAGQAKMKVNGISIITAPTNRPLEIINQIVIGQGFNKYKDTEGYVGCIRNLKIQGKLQDAISLIKGSNSEGFTVRGLTIDGCNITDYCKLGHMCKHGGRCLSDWTSMACDCTDTHYTGKACSFPEYKRTCDEYYQAGVRTTGVMLVDLDGAGMLDPVHVQCEMNHEVEYEFYGKTIVEHNLVNETTVREAMMRDHRKILTYRELNRVQLMHLTELSDRCEQYIRYDCFHSPIRLGKLTWFKSANGEMVEYLGTGERSPGRCSCALNGSCEGLRCLCDNNTMEAAYDEGYNRVNRQLPLTEIRVEQQSDPLDPGSANFTLGPLVCWGNKFQKSETAVTFSNEEDFLRSQPWQKGDLRISFRTHKSQAIILYQTGTPENINYLYVVVTSDNTVEFSFHWGKKTLDLIMYSQVPVSNGHWHQLSIETDEYSIRCTLDMVEKIVDIPANLPKVAAFSGVLYIGGLPASMKDPFIADIEGIVGCMRGLTYNNLDYPLTGLIDPSTPHVLRQCMASCWPNPCQNGAQCVEKWGNYQCICVNPWAHSGYNCQRDINKDSVTFLGTKHSFLHFKRELGSSLLDSSVVLSFRTLERNVQLLYIHDHLNNFIQLYLRNGKQMITKFNRYTTILNQTKTYNGTLDDGEWHQVVIDNADGYIKVIVDVDNEPTRNSYRKQDLTSYSQTPFEHDELIRPVRPVDAPEPGINVYVGGVPEEMIHTTQDLAYFPTLGCIRGFKVGQTFFNLQEQAMTTADVSPKCENGCSSRPCLHGGICNEGWQNKNFTCDCSDSEYAGPTCNIESSGLFGGQSILQYKYNPPPSVQQTTTERLEMIFQVNTRSTRNMILMFIYSEKYFTHDFLIVYIDPINGVYLNTNQGYSIHGVGKIGQFADGRPHKLLYQHNRSEMILTLDDEGIGRVPVPDNMLDMLDTIMIGGILDSQYDRMIDISGYKKYNNFTGCISEVKFYPVGDIPYILRPLKDLRGEENTLGNVTTFGPTVDRCTVHNKMPTTTVKTTRATFAPTPKPDVYFPPWNPGPAETIFIGPPRVTPINPTPTNATTPTTTTAMETEMMYGSVEDGQHDDKIVAIALSIVAFLLIIAIIIAIILRRRRHKERVDQKKKEEHLRDMELKKPLNDMDAVMADNHQNQNYLARLDEFSMVSVTLGARPIKTDGTSTFKPSTRDSNHIYTSVPQTEDDAPTDIDSRFYNRKKNRPASSISEVLEEMERQKNNPDADPEDLETLGDAPLQNLNVTPIPRPNVQFMRMVPIQEDFIYTILPPKEFCDARYSGVLDETPCSDSLNSAEIHGDHGDADDDENDADNESDSPSPPPPPISEYNGDSGYEAESKPEEEEEEDALLTSGSYHGDRDHPGEVTPLTPDSYNVYSEGSPPPTVDTTHPCSADVNNVPVVHSDRFQHDDGMATSSSADSRSSSGHYKTAVPVIPNGLDRTPDKLALVMAEGQESCL